MNKTKVIKILLELDCWLILLFGGFMAWVMWTSGLTIIGLLFSSLLPPSGGFFGIIFLSTTFVILKLTDRNKHAKKYYATLIIGLTISTSMYFPLLFTSQTVYNAENEFSQEFGSTWRSDIPEEVLPYFQSSTFSIPKYFLGEPQKDCIVKTHIPYFRNKSISLYFDVYMPKGPTTNLPGQNSTIIRIHGGGWSSGDKGPAEFAVQTCRYFAAQGYIVFDIQYGLNNLTFWYELFNFQGAPSYLLGNYSIHDIAIHIGKFTDYLADNASLFGANLDSVFLWGGSAGGYLTALVGFGYEDPYFTSIFNGTLSIKGLIPRYPGNNASEFFIGMMPELAPGKLPKDQWIFDKFTPSKLINDQSPPALIFHGLYDKLTTPAESLAIKAAMAKYNRPCAILFMPFAGHATDFIYSNNYHQVFMYYMERFLYIHR